MDVRVEPWRKLSTEKLMLLNCGVGEDSWESLGHQGDQTSQSWRKSVLNIHWKFDAETEAPILWPPDVKSWFIGKDPDAGKDWGQKEKGTTEDEMVGWHQWHGREFKQAPGESEGPGSQECCSSWGHEELDMTERLNNTWRIRKSKKQKFQYFGHLVGRADSLEKTLMVGRLKAKGVEGGRRWDG